VEKAEERVIYCEVYSRCVGYIRPVAAWNEGKQQEFKDRVTYRQPTDKAGNGD